MKHLSLPIAAVLGLLIATYAATAEPLVRHDYLSLRLKAKALQPQFDKFDELRAARRLGDGNGSCRCE